MMFKHLFTAGFLGTFAVLASASSPTKCRCLYGQSCWPSDTAFSQLSRNLSQPLVHPTAVASPCYTNPSSASCSDVKAHFTDALWRPDQPGGYQFQNFESYIQKNGTIDACYLNVTLGFPCKQGSIPPIGVDVRSPADIQAAIRFAKANNLKLVVKNTGHDYQARSAGRGAFMVWTHHMKNLTYHEAFVPSGGPPQAASSAITTGAGDQWGDVYAFALQHGRMLVGPFSLGGSIGTAGGFAMGGGIGAFTPKHGLGIDNVLQYTLVLADGKIVTANAFQNTDLFWALRGGGPGTYGILLSVTYKAHPSFPVSIATFHANLTSDSVAQTILTEALRKIVPFTDLGWGGYMYIIKPNLFNGLWVAPNVSQSVLAKALDPFGAFLNLTSGGQGGVFYNTSSSYYGWYDKTFLGTSGSQVTGNILPASRLLSRELALSNPAGVASTILSANSIFTGIEMILGGQVNKIDSSSVGVNPSFRHSVANVLINERWADGISSVAIAQQIDMLKAHTKTLDGISTDSGSYMNEGSLFERDFKKTFYGSHYTALRNIKFKYDPSSLFVVANGIGSDEWDKELVCLL
ncbi:FAD binding domain-containing protein [Crepidotus variabilis]|uniref:FAD binding domain-containing protein n=1 Tax=Crepidotus variabilis TaxID=179855 RepID=A0A9P6E8D4_9AGAR|nr:FAD binding domain-containing protein [Crepidotus variabilis]